MELRAVPLVAAALHAGAVLRLALAAGVSAVQRRRPSAAAGRANMGDGSEGTLMSEHYHRQHAVFANRCEAGACALHKANDCEHSRHSYNRR